VNEPDRRPASDGFDADAIFADIVAHLSDEAVEPEGLGTPWLDDATADNATAHNATADDATGDDATADGATADGAADASATDLPPGGGWLPVNLPPALPLPGHPDVIPTPQVWRAHEVDDEYEEHFEPPPVAPLPVGDLQFWAIIAGMTGGPLMLLYLVLFNRDAGSDWILASIALSVVGFALLILRLPREREDDDDGARL
jgi:hypothetical protein